MTQEEFRNDMVYQVGISVGKTMMEAGLITPDEYAEIDTILLQMYRPYLGSLCSENACYSLRLE